MQNCVMRNGVRKHSLKVWHSNRRNIWLRCEHCYQIDYLLRADLIGRRS